MPSPDAGEGIDGCPVAIGCHRGALDPQPRHLGRLPSWLICAQHLRHS